MDVMRLRSLLEILACGVSSVNNKCLLQHPRMGREARLGSHGLFYVPLTGVFDIGEETELVFRTK